MTSTSIFSSKIRSLRKAQNLLRVEQPTLLKLAAPRPILLTLIKGI